MVASEELRRELESIEARIEHLREVLYQVDADRHNVRGQVGWIRALQIRALKVGVRRQIRELDGRRGAARNCHAEATKYEEWLRFSGRMEETKTAVGC